MLTGQTLSLLVGETVRDASFTDSIDQHVAGLAFTAARPAVFLTEVDEASFTLAVVAEGLYAGQAGLPVVSLTADDLTLAFTHRKAILAPTGTS